MCNEGITNIRKVGFCFVFAALCVIASTVLHLISFEELGMYCTIFGGLFFIFGWFWLLKWLVDV